MEEPIKGDVVVIPFPYSDLTETKRRPALILAQLRGDDVVLCQITSQTVRDEYALEVKDSDFKSGSLRQSSNIRPNRLFTADQGIILYKVGRVKAEIISNTIEKVIKILRD